jgi:hypothetical protein
MTITFGIGTTQGGIVDLSTLGVSYPLVQPDPYFDVVTLGDGSKRGIGAAHIAWKWGFLGDKMQQSTINNPRENLRDYCPGASANVFITTPTNENDAAVTYSAIMIWPFPETRSPADAHRRMDFVVEFRNCVPV